MSKKRRFHSNKMSPRIVYSAIYDDNLMKDYLAAIEKNIWIEMDKRKISIREFGEMCNIHYSHLSNVFSGKAHFGLTTLIKICIALNVPPQDLFPVDLNIRDSNGDRFNEITKSMDLASINFLLRFCNDFRKEYDRLTSKDE